MAAHRIFCTKDTLSEIIRLRKTRPYSTVLSTIEKLGDIYLECKSAMELKSLAAINPIVSKLLKRPNRNVEIIQSAIKEIKSPLADDIFLLLPPDSKPYKDYRDKKGVLVTSSLTDMQVIEDLCTSHRPFNLLTDEQKRKLSKNGEEYEDISSWKDVLSTINVTPINAAIIIDNYLLSSNFERRKPSLYSLIQALAPSGLTVPFHLTIFLYNKDGKLLKENMEKVISEIHDLKLGSKIMVSIVVHTSGDVTHDRYILTNYHLITSGHGFGVMDYRGVKQNAQGHVTSTFFNIAFFTSINSYKHIHSHVLEWMKDIYVNGRGMESLYAFEVGDDFNNRLLSE